MKKLIATIGTIAVLLGVSGCATQFGAHFDQSKAGNFELGNTSKAEVIAALGLPRKDQTVTWKKDLAGNELRSPAILNQISYYFQDNQGEPTVVGIQPSRSAYFSFTNDKLVDYRVISSFKQTSTNFDENLVKKVEKGKTTETDLLRLFGPPGGRGNYPFAKEPGGSLVTYNVYLFDASTRKGTHKLFRVFFSPSRVVSDFELEITVK